MGENKIDKIYNIVADITIKRLEKEKETKLSRSTLKMISLTQRLFNTTMLR